MPWALLKKYLGWNQQANDIFCAAVANCGRTSITVSEEEEKPMVVEAVRGGHYICCFDPIDGSSNLDACISSGSIFGIYNPGECVIEESDDADAILSKCITNVKKVKNSFHRFYSLSHL
jgi:fructose-1,6-bisphosphatase I